MCAFEGLMLNLQPLRCLTRSNRHVDALSYEHPLKGRVIR